jgi:hypothetical protein
VITAAPRSAEAGFRHPEPNQTNVPTNASILVGGDDADLLSSYALRDPQGNVIALQKTEQVVGSADTFSKRSLTSLRPATALAPNTKYTVTLQFPSLSVPQIYDFTTGSGPDAAIPAAPAPAMYIYRHTGTRPNGCPVLTTQMSVRTPRVAGAVLYLFETAYPNELFVVQGFGTHLDASPAVDIRERTLAAVPYPASYRVRPIAITGDALPDSALVTKPFSEAVQPPELPLCGSRPYPPGNDYDYDDEAGCSAARSPSSLGVALALGLLLVGRRRRSA